MSLLLAVLLSAPAAGVHSLALRSDGRALAVGLSSGAIRIRPVAGGTRARSLSGHDAPVTALAFHPDGHTLASGCEQGRVIVWDTRRGKKVREAEGHDGAVRALAFGRDGWLASAGADHTVRVRAKGQAKIARTFREPKAPLVGLAFTSGGQEGGELLIAPAADRRVTILDLTEMCEARTVELPETLRPVAHRVGARVLIGTEERRPFWLEPETGELTPGAEIDAGWAESLASATGRLVAGGRDGKVRVWSGPGDPAAVIDAHEGAVDHVAVSADGHAIASSACGEVSVWSVDGGRRLRRWRLE